MDLRDSLTAWRCRTITVPGLDDARGTMPGLPMPPQDDSDDAVLALDAHELIMGPGKIPSVRGYGIFADCGVKVRTLFSRGR